MTKDQLLNCADWNDEEASRAWASHQAGMRVKSDNSDVWLPADFFRRRAERLEAQAETLRHKASRI